MQVSMKRSIFHEVRTYPLYFVDPTEQTLLTMHTPQGILGTLNHKPEFLMTL